jgi:hypothetical protein
LTVTQTGAGNAFVVEDSTSPDTSPFVITGTGQMVVGNTTPLVSGYSVTPATQWVSNGGIAGAFAYSASTSGGGVWFAKSRAVTAGTHTVVQSGDEFGATNYFGSDGTAFIEGARISAAVDGTPGTNDMPGRLVFSTTADGAASPTERMRIDSAGSLGIGTASPNASAILDVQSTTKGVRMPNMTTTQKNAISSPAAGLMVFDTTLSKLCVYSGAAWQTITSV